MRGRAVLFISCPLSLILPQPVLPVTSKLLMATFIRPSFTSVLRHGGSSEWGRYARSRRELLSVKMAKMVSFRIQFVKSNQYRNKCFLFWLGLFSLAFDFLAYFQEWTLHKICPTAFPHSWRIKKKKKESCLEGEPPRPLVFSIIYYSQEVLQPKSLFHCQCKANPFNCLPQGAPQQIACIRAFYQAWESVQRTLKDSSFLTDCISGCPSLGTL